MEEQVLKCNHQPNGFCRVELKHEAIVTNCSHILCRKCADSTGLFQTQLSQRRCPVCATPLPNEDDAVLARLKPSEEYKSSVLGGLDPATIVDCASRALSFWNYQVLQETAYQQHMLGILNNKYSHLRKEVDKLVTDANTEITQLNEKINGITLDYNSLQKKNADILTASRDKTKKYNEMRYMYDKLKQRWMLQQHREQTSENADHAVTALAADMSNDKTRTIHDFQLSPVVNRQSVGNSGSNVAQCRTEQMHPCQSTDSDYHHSLLSTRMLPPERPSEHQNPSRLPVAISPTHRRPLSSFARPSVDQPTGIISSLHHHLPDRAGASTAILPPLSQRSGGGSRNSGRYSANIARGPISSAMKTGSAEKAKQVYGMRGDDRSPSRAISHGSVLEHRYSLLPRRG